MSALKFLTRLTNGRVQLIAAIQASAGGADANKVLATNGSGKIDSSFLPAGIEIQTESMVGEVAFLAGDFINIYDNASVRTARKALASDPDRLAHGFVLVSSSINDTVTVYTKGVNTAITGNENTKYYLSSVTAGEASATAPADTSGHLQQVLGFGTGNGVLYEFDDPIYFA